MISVVRSSDRERVAALHGVRAAAAAARWQGVIQLLKFCTVGASGYLVNLTVYTALVLGAGVPVLIAASCSFGVAVGNNYAWNRLWTFRENRGPVGTQGMRFLTVSVLALCANLTFLSAMTAGGIADIPAQAAAIAMATPLSFFGNKAWTFGAGTWADQSPPLSHEESSLLASLD